jgi:hypothetical protein
MCEVYPGFRFATPWALFLTCFAGAVNFAQLAKKTKATQCCNNELSWIDAEQPENRVQSGAKRNQLYSSSSFPLTRLLRTVGFVGVAPGLASGVGGADTARVPTSERNFPFVSYSRRYCIRFLTTPCT